MTPSQLRQTHTVVTMGVSQATFDEICAKLRAAGYDHAFMPDGEVDMSGLALEVNPDAERPADPKLTIRISELEEEVAVSDKIIEQRARVLREIPACEEHGDTCVPSAIDWVRTAKEAILVLHGIGYVYQDKEWRPPETRVSREAFERHWKRTRGQRKHRELLERGLRDDGTYMDASVQRHWWTWQAAERFLFGIVPPARSPSTPNPGEFDDVSRAP